MVWQQGTKAVIMLNRVIEKGTLKCHQYWPAEEGEEVACEAAGITVANIGTVPGDHYNITTLRWMAAVAVVVVVAVAVAVVVVVVVVVVSPPSQDHPPGPCGEQGGHPFPLHHLARLRGAHLPRHLPTVPRLVLSGFN